MVGVEYEAAQDTADPTVLGQPMTLLPEGHPGMEFPDYVLHMWFVDNPAGTFADFNPALTCPAPALPPTGSAGLLSSDGSGTPWSWLAAALTAVAGLLALGGWRLRRAQRR